jgi:2-keto-4-pentenoate hydratase
MSTHTPNAPTNVHLNPAQINALALQLQHAQDTAQLLPLPSTAHPGLTAAQGYEIAQQLHQLRLQTGAVPVGRKIGFTNPQLWPVFGVTAPVWGYMYAHTVLPFKCWQEGHSLAALVQPKIEPEVVLHFHSAPPAGADAAGVLACVDWVAHGFELVHCPYANWQFTAADAIACGALHGALLLGPQVPVAALGTGTEQALAALQSLQLGLHRNQAWLQNGEGSNVMGSPVLAAAHLLALLALQDPSVALQAGELVTTGTLTAAYSVQAGEQWHTVVQPPADHSASLLPGLRLSFTA